MFEFLKDMGNYEERKVANFSKGDLVVDTCAISDSDQPYETGIKRYKNGNWVIVEMYNSKEEARSGHNEWVKKVIAKKLPRELKDVATSTIKKALNQIKIMEEGA